MAEWYLLPGMGASAAMYNVVKREVSFKINFIDWPEYRGEKTYSDVALRVIRENGITDGDIIGGSSLGGMVSLEMTRQIRPRAVILLGSAMYPHEIQRLLTMLSPLAEVTPISLIQSVLGKYGNLVSSMFSKSDAEFIRAMSVYLPLWSGYTGSANTIYRLHGKKDHIIPCPSSGGEIIEDAGHLLVMTHAKATAAFLGKLRKAL